MGESVLEGATDRGKRPRLTSTTRHLARSPRLHARARRTRARPSLRGRRVHYGSEGKAAAGLARLPSRPERFRHTSGGAGQS